MKTVDQSKVRKKFYIVNLSIYLLAVMLLAALYILSVKRESEANLEILTQSITDQKKIYLQSVVLGCIADIEALSESKSQELNERAATLAETLSLILKLQFTEMSEIPESFPLDDIMSDLCSNDYQYRLFDRNSDMAALESRSPIFQSAPLLGDSLIAIYMTEEQFDYEIRSAGEDIVRNRKLPNDEYAWINHIKDYNGGDGYAVRLVHPNMPETEGMLLSTEMTDIHGNTPYLEELKGINNSGEVFHDYYFKKMNSDKISHKLSYARLYKDFDWIISTGVYLDDLDSLIESEYLKIRENIARSIRFLSIFLILVAAIAIIVLILFERHINTVLNEYTDRLITAQNLGKSGWWEYDFRTSELVIPEETRILYGLNNPVDRSDMDLIRKAVKPEYRAFFDKKIIEFINGSEESIEFPIIYNKDEERWFWLKSRTELDKKGQPLRIFGSVRDITAEKDAELQNEKLISELKEALEQIKTLGGLVPICASCKKIRDDKGYWNQLEAYIEKHSEVSFTHGICPDCMKKIYGDKKWFKKKKGD